MNKYTVLFCCEKSAFIIANMLHSFNKEFPLIRFIKLPCAGKIDSLYILKAFEEDAFSVGVLGCYTGSCQNFIGNTRAKQVVEYTKKILNGIGIKENRLFYFETSSEDSQNFYQNLNKFLGV